MPPPCNLEGGKPWIRAKPLLNMGLINKVDMVCLSHVGYGVQLTFRALALRRSRHF